MLAEKVRAQYTIGGLLVSTDDNLVFVRASSYSYLDGWLLCLTYGLHVPPPITLRRTSLSCFTFSGRAACKVSYKGHPIMLQVAPVCRSAIVDT